jgi:hypothetical protein
MDRMKTGLLFFLAWFVFSGPVMADDWSYAPEYEASPSAKLGINDPSAIPSPTPIVVPPGRQPEVTCKLTITLPADTKAPMEARFVASGRADGQAVNQFRYLFGDGESATGSGTMRHTYTAPGSYQVRVTPMIEGVVNVPICKSKIVVTGEAVSKGDSRVDLAIEPSPTALATSAATAMVQPKTGPSQWYWVSLLSLLTVWLGAVSWYQRQHPRIG